MVRRVKAGRHHASQCTRHRYYSAKNKTEGAAFHGRGPAFSSSAATRPQQIKRMEWQDAAVQQRDLEVALKSGFRFAEL